MQDLLTKSGVTAEQADNVGYVISWVIQALQEGFNLLPCQHYQL